jgi:N-acetylglutamate synthase-like GNAT family acetyltransferase
MAKTAEEHEIIVCKDTLPNAPTIIAIIAVNIRTVFWSGTPIKVGWVYGLRVDEDYQRKGIGMVLSAELERRCRERSVSMLHLTVNLENEKAISLYTNLGYQHASNQAPATKFLTRERRVSDDLLVVQMVPEAAAVLAIMNYENMDMSPAPSTMDGFLKLIS